jgi:hypothetical protein
MFFFLFGTTKRKKKQFGKYQKRYHRCKKIRFGKDVPWNAVGTSFSDTNRPNGIPKTKKKTLPEKKTEPKPSVKVGPKGGEHPVSLYQLVVSNIPLLRCKIILSLTMPHLQILLLCRAVGCMPVPIAAAAPPPPPPPPHSSGGSSSSSSSGSAAWAAGRSPTTPPLGYNQGARPPLT